ncbi:UNVERIFIED_CONTAM: hypothetical protein RMT77_001657 [Armadillidium vulgare]
MDSTICVRASSASPPASLVAPVAVKPNVLESHTPQLMTHAAAAAAAVEQQRLQQLYQLAIAERLRLASGLAWPRPHPQFDNGNGAPHFLPHPALNSPHNVLAAAAAAGHGYMYPWRFVDPRSLYRVPEEPKPQHSYIGLIAMAILSSPEKKLVLSDIYAYILENYAYFRSRGPGWRNSIRHNLSLNDCFVKAGRSANGKGHYWAIHPANIDDFARGDFRRRRAQRRVRKHLGLQVDDDSSPEPPPSSPPPITSTEGPTHLVGSDTNLLSPSQPTQAARKRQFDVASLLAPDDLPQDALLKARRFRTELSPPPPSSAINCSSGRETSPDVDLVPKDETSDDVVSNGPLIDEARNWSILGWPQGHSWTILTPPQEESEHEQRPSTPDH